MAEDKHLKAAMDRLTILRSAHAALTEFGVGFDIMALLATADWLAGNCVEYASVVDDNEGAEG